MRADSREFGAAPSGLHARRGRRIAAARFLLAIMLAWGLGAATGWIARAYHDNPHQGQPVRWHEVDFIGVVDGDTIKVRWDGQATSVRMLNINTPERGHPGYQAATDHLRALIGKSPAVQLEFEQDSVIARDHFGRLLCYVWLDGKCLNIEQVRAGHSAYWTKYGAGRHPREFQEAAASTRNSASSNESPRGFPFRPFTMNLSSIVRLHRPPPSI